MLSLILPFSSHCRPSSNSEGHGLARKDRRFRPVGTTLAFFRRSAILLLLFFFAVAPLAAEEVRITIAATTDTHANIWPLDYYRNQPANRGLAKAFTIIQSIRAQNPNTLLVDCGDTIQGTPLGYYFSRRDLERPNPVVLVMNRMGYDAMAVGNHEFNFGLKALWKAKKESRFPWLSANTRGVYADPVRAFPPYLVKEVAGVRVGILGLTTPGIPRWELPQHYTGYKFQGIVSTARKFVSILRNRERADVVILIVHSGLDRDTETGQIHPGQVPGENAVWELAHSIPGIDAIIFGHTHQEVEGRFVKGVLLTQPKNWAQSVAQVDLSLSRRDGRWKVEAKQSKVIRVTDEVVADPEILVMTREHEEAAQKYLETPIARVDKTLSAQNARYEDNPLVDLILKAEMEYGKADVALASVFNPAAKIPAGPVTVRQIASLYFYENTLYTVEMTGKALKLALEHAAEYFQGWPVAPGTPLTSGKLFGYNYDMAEGVSYKIDLRRPPGSRIVDLKFHDQPLQPQQKLRLAVNSYRYAGGGQYTMLRHAPILFQSAVEVRDLLIDFVTRNGTLPTKPTGNWEIIPPEAREALVQSVASGDGAR